MEVSNKPQLGQHLNINDLLDFDDTVKSNFQVYTRIKPHVNLKLKSKACQIIKNNDKQVWIDPKYSNHSNFYYVSILSI